jgi:hypothetical protein
MQDAGKEKASLNEASLVSRFSARVLVPLVGRLPSFMQDEDLGTPNWAILRPVASYCTVQQWGFLLFLCPNHFITSFGVYQSWGILHTFSFD